MLESQSQDPSGRLVIKSRIHHRPQANVPHTLQPYGLLEASMELVHRAPGATGSRWQDPAQTSPAHPLLKKLILACVRCKRAHPDMWSFAWCERFKVSKEA
eukprot:6459380-Amphidinium_carterae.2